MPTLFANYLQKKAKQENFKSKSLELNIIFINLEVNMRDTCKTNYKIRCNGESSVEAKGHCRANA